MAPTEQKPLVYLETSFISYLTARVSSDEKLARSQALTRRWWEEEGPKYTPVVSDAVWMEAVDGDPRQAALRTAFLEGIPSLAVTPEAERLAAKLLEAHALPDRSNTDALHIALAAINGVRLLLTWNCRHIANSETLPKTAVTLEKAGYRCPAIATPAQRLEDLENE